MSDTGPSPYHPARLSFVSGQRAPYVEAVDITRYDGDPKVTYTCGHFAFHARHFEHRVGYRYRCLKCGEAIAKALPEFANKEKV